MGVEKLKDNRLRRPAGAARAETGYDMIKRHRLGPGASSPSSPRPTGPSTGSPATISSAPSPTCRSRATPTARRIPRAHLRQSRSPRSRALNAPMIGRAAGPVRLLRRLRRRRLRHRHHAGDRPPRSARPISSTVKGAAACRSPTAGSWQGAGWDGSYFPHHPHRRAPRPTPRPGSPIRAKQISLMEVHDCFFDHRAGDHGGPGRQRRGHGGARRDGRGCSTPTAPSPCQIDGGPEVLRAIRSAPRACG